MAQISVEVQDLAARVATEAKSLRMLLNGNNPTNGALLTSAKANVVAAINELHGLIQNAGASIDDGNINSASVWSSQKTSTEINAAIEALKGVSPETLDTLAEIAEALQNNPDIITDILAAIGLKADANHVHGISEITGLQAALDGKALTVHSHTVDQIDGLQELLDGIDGAEYATNAETAAGTVTNKAVTPASLRALTGDLTDLDLVAVFEANLGVPETNLL